MQAGVCRQWDASITFPLAHPYQALRAPTCHRLYISSSRRRSLASWPLPLNCGQKGKFQHEQAARAQRRRHRRHRQHATPAANAT